MKKNKITILLCLAAMMLPLGINAQSQYKIGACDWMMLKRQKLLKEEKGHLFLTYHGAALGNYVFEQFLRDE